MFFGFLWTKQYSGKSDKVFDHTHTHTPTAHLCFFIYIFHCFWGSVQELVSEVLWAAAQVRQIENNRAEKPRKSWNKSSIRWRMDPWDVCIFTHMNGWFYWLASISSYHGNPSSGHVVCLWWIREFGTVFPITKVQTTFCKVKDLFSFVLIYFCCISMHLPCISSHHIIRIFGRWN